MDFQGPPRVKGVTISKPILYGNISVPLTPAMRTPANGPFIDPTHTHRWTLFVRSFGSHDLSHYVKKVSFKLHESFKEPIRTFTEAPFELTETGWGEFEIIIKIHFLDPAEKPISILHHLQLYPKDDPTAPPLTGASALKKEKVIAEKYDEIIFHEPTPIMHEALLRSNELASAAAASGEASPKKNALYNPQTEQAELKRLMEASEYVKASYTKYTKKLHETEAAIQSLKSLTTGNPHKNP